MATLYDIDERLADAIKFSVDEETGEITDFDVDAFNAIQAERKDKIENIALYIKNLEAENIAIKAEEENLKKRRTEKENKIEFMKNYLANSMITNNDKAFETSKVSLKFRKSEAVNIYDMDKIPKDYMTVKTEYKPDKKAIKEAIKGGGVIEGANIVEKNTLVIK